MVAGVGFFRRRAPPRNANWLFLGGSFEVESVDRDTSVGTGSRNKRSTATHEYRRLAGFPPLLPSRSPFSFVLSAARSEKIWKEKYFIQQRTSYQLQCSHDVRVYFEIASSETREREMIVCVACTDDSSLVV